MKEAETKLLGFLETIKVPDGKTEIMEALGGDAFVALSDLTKETMSDGGITYQFLGGVGGEYETHKDKQCLLISYNGIRYMFYCK